jgi:hypothetical protein
MAREIHTPAIELPRGAVVLRAMNSHSLILSTSIALFCAAAAQAQSLTQLSTFTTGTGSRAGSAEILAYTKDDNFTVLSTVGDNTGGSFGVQILSLSGAGALSEKGFADFSSIFGAAANWNGASSVAADPLGRGFGAVSLIPAASSTTQGKVAFFDYRGATANGARSLVVLDVGFHPDSVRFSDDGTKLFVANEGEFIPSSGVNAPGSICIIDISSVTGIGNVSSLTNANVSTFDFQAANLGAGVTLAGLRNHSIAAVGTSGTFIGTVPNFNDPLVFNDANFHLGIEPEYITQSGSKLFVSLQENNAVGVFDLTSNKWSQIHKLGTISQLIDASDQDGPGGTTALSIDDTVKGLPMPDTLASYTVAGTTYFVTANEGDARPDDRDISRFGDIAGNDSMNNILDTDAPSAFPLTQTGLRANSVLGRLSVSRLDGDTDADGKIDDPTMIGTRSFSIWNATTGALVWDSGDSPLTNLETILAGLDPTFHNMNSGLASNFDTRSDDKGPEPEAITIGEFDGKPYAFVGLERQNGLLMFDISDPTAPFFVDYVNSAGSSLVSPESLAFIPAADSPTGSALLLGGYEVSNGIGVYAVPEPSTAAALIGGVGLLVGRRRRRA